MSIENFDTNTLLSLMARLQFIKKAAHDKGFQAKSDPRYTAIEIKVDDLLTRLQKLIAPVMLAEIEGIQKLTKDLYEMLGEQEESVIAKGNGDRGN